MSKTLKKRSNNRIIGQIICIKFTEQTSACMSVYSTTGIFIKGMLWAPWIPLFRSAWKGNRWMAKEGKETIHRLLTLRTSNHLQHVSSSVKNLIHIGERIFLPPFSLMGNKTYDDSGETSREIPFMNYFIRLKSQRFLPVSRGLFFDYDN